MNGRTAGFDLHARVGAALVDIFLIAFGPLVVASLLSVLSNTFLFLCVPGFGLLYYAFCETRYGQTPGKRIFGIKVYAISGELTGWKVFVRTALRPVDALPFMYLLGFFFVVVTRRQQRLGDLLAGTIVAVERPSFDRELNAAPDVVRNTYASIPLRIVGR